MNFINKFDAGEWADKFLEEVATHSSVAQDRETIQTWFSNAIMAGYDHNKEIENNLEELREKNIGISLSSSKEGWKILFLDGSQAQTVRHENIKTAIMMVFEYFIQKEKADKDLDDPLPVPQTVCDTECESCQ